MQAVLRILTLVVATRALSPPKRVARALFGDPTKSPLAVRLYQYELVVWCTRAASRSKSTSHDVRRAPFVGQQPQEFELENNCYECATCGGHQKLRLHEDHMEMEQHQPCPWFLTFMGPPGPLIACAFANSKCTTRVPYHNITSVESDYICFKKAFMVWGGSLWRHAPFGFQPAKADADVVAAR